jgi:hypothetical protein
MYAKYEGKQELKSKTLKLQEMLTNYLLTLKNQFLASMDNILKSLLNKLNYPYLYDDIQVSISNKIKTK